MIGACGKKEEAGHPGEPFYYLISWAKYDYANYADLCRSMQYVCIAELSYFFVTSYWSNNTAEARRLTGRLAVSAPTCALRKVEETCAAPGAKTTLGWGRGAGYLYVPTGPCMVVFSGFFPQSWTRCCGSM